MPLHDKIQELCQLLETCRIGPAMDDLRALGNAMHGVMCDKDYPELNWMPITFEDVAESIPNAVRCSQEDLAEMEADHERKVRQYRMNGGM
jgi:hypothetical protein